MRVKITFNGYPDQYEAALAAFMRIPEFYKNNKNNVNLRLEHSFVCDNYYENYYKYFKNIKGIGYRTYKDNPEKKDDKYKTIYKHIIIHFENINSTNQVLENEFWNITNKQGLRPCYKVYTYNNNIYNFYRRTKKKVWKEYNSSIELMEPEKVNIRKIARLASKVSSGSIEIGYYNFISFNKKKDV